MNFPFDLTRKRKFTTYQHDFSRELSLINSHGNSLPQSVDTVSFSSTSESLGPLQVLHQNNASHNGLGGHLHEKSCHGEKNGSNAIKIVDASTVGTTLSATSSCIEQNENDRPSNNDVHSNNGSLVTGFIDNVGVNYRGQGVVSVPIMKKTGADMDKSRHSLEEMISQRNENNSANNVLKDGKGNEINGIGVVSSESLDGKSKSHARKLAPIVAEKVWDGSLQLNSSVTVSAIASFKRFKLILKIQLHYKYFNLCVTLLSSATFENSANSVASSFKITYLYMSKYKPYISLSCGY